MIALLLKLAEQLNSSVFILLMILIIIAFGLYKAGQWSEIFKSHDDKIKKIEGLAEKVLLMGQKVDLIYDNTLGPGRRPLASLSPINLTKVGFEIVEKIKANDILIRCLPMLEKEVEKEKPNSAYDIQMVSLKIAKEKMITCLNETELTAVKQEAFDRGLLVEDIMSVFGVLLRNHVLSQKGISISEVDKYQPTQAQ
jgi:hypothetical protein